MNKKKQALEQAKLLQSGEDISEVLKLSPSLRDIDANTKKTLDLLGFISAEEAGVDIASPDAIERVLKRNYPDLNQIADFRILNDPKQKEEFIKYLKQQGRTFPESNVLGRAYKNPTTEGKLVGFLDTLNPQLADREQAIATALHEAQHFIDRKANPDFKGLPRTLNRDKMESLAKMGRTDIEELLDLPKAEANRVLQERYKKSPIKMLVDKGAGHHADTLTDTMELKALTKKLGLKKLAVGIPVLSGLAAAGISGDASAAIPILDQAESLDLPNDPIERKIELGETISPEEHNKIKQQALKKMRGL